MSKARIAERVAEVLGFFADGNRQASIGDIIRRYRRPQSSTSELMNCLVETGILYKDPFSRTYTPTPKLAVLGTACQPKPIASGKLFGIMDDLAADLRCRVGLFGIIGMQMQVFRWAGDPKFLGKFASGSSAPVYSCPAGLLLLSALDPAAAGRILWRALAEAGPQEGLSLDDLKREVARFDRLGFATGNCGLVPNRKIASVLLSDACGDRNLALGAVYENGPGMSCDKVIASLRCVAGGLCRDGAHFGESSMQGCKE